jgi:hypothetical protein
MNERRKNGRATKVYDSGLGAEEEDSAADDHNHVL